MAVLDVLKAGNPVLKQVAEPVSFVNKKIRSLLVDMAETMYKTDGCGLAAPQIGVSSRIIVLDDGNGLLELINPVIVHKEGTQIGLEGCLSVPGYYGDVVRFNKVIVHAINKHNKKVIIRAEGFLARILQHEIDHLDGILFIEKATDLKNIVQNNAD
ncbi:peptide deformylase [Veillonella montpellierensis]|uniref:peptide deformylase n=1 Tax=Veillonella montpellierensis TaxID=187328 RepID=UPI0023F8B5B2|nr:peptide deformylase [Veillonella montpellierensis]